MTRLTSRIRNYLKVGVGFRSLRLRIMGMFGTLIVAISAFMYLFFPAALERQALSGVETKAQAIGAMAAYSVASAVYSSDVNGAEAVLRGALENDDVAYAEVTDSEGSVLIALTSNLTTVDGGAEPGPAVHERIDNVFPFSQPVVFNDQKIGEVHLELSLASIRAEVAAARRVIGIISLSVLLVGLLAASGIGRFVIAPLQIVASVAERIALGDGKERVPAHAGGEVGQVARSFNRMVDQLQTAHREAAESKVLLEQILDNIPGQVTMFDKDFRCVYANPLAFPDSDERISAIGRTPTEHAESMGVHEESAGEVEQAMRQCVEENVILTREQTVTGSGETETHFLQLYSPIRDVDSEDFRVIVYGADITERRRAAAELGHIRQRLLESQNLESVGRLAGGIAHDFNNLLTTIIGNADFLLDDLPTDGSARVDVDEIRRAAGRAANLTQQLLAFSRRQVVQPEIVNLNDRIGVIDGLLRSALGEELSIRKFLDPEIKNVQVDPAQIEKAIIQLTVNARSRMSAGGALKIRTENVVLGEELGDAEMARLPSGPYVGLSVCDDGVCLSAEALERVFEPFYSEASAGGDNGLGLATVRGIVEQAGGWIGVESSERHGTAFKILLPALEGQDREREPRPKPPLLRSAGETILVVEDQEEVLAMTARILKRCGYSVICAPTPDEALRIVERRGANIHLLLTDVVMPGMSGAELAKRASSSCENMRVLFMSGYPDDHLQHRGVLANDVSLIEKPFTAKTLSRTVREVLDRPLSSRLLIRAT